MEHLSFGSWQAPLIDECLSADSVGIYKPDASGAQRAERLPAKPDYEAAEFSRLLQQAGIV